MFQVFVLNIRAKTPAKGYADGKVQVEANFIRTQTCASFTWKIIKQTDITIYSNVKTFDFQRMAIANKVE